MKMVFTYNGEWYKGYRKGYGEEVMKKKMTKLYIGMQVSGKIIIRMDMENNIILIYGNVIKVNLKMDILMVINKKGHHNLLYMKNKCKNKKLINYYFLYGQNFHLSYYNNFHEKF